MPQVSKMYVKIINKRLLPMRIPIDDIRQVNSVMGRYLVNNQQAISVNESGKTIPDPWLEYAPAFIFSDQRNSMYLGL